MYIKKRKGGTISYTTLSMTDREKDHIWETIASQTFFAMENHHVRKPVLSRLYYQGLLPILKQQYVSFGKEKYAFGTMVGILVISGTISAFAQDTLPGDFLYPVKTHVTEKIETVIAVEPEQKAEVEARLATKRLEEAEKLVLLGKGDPSQVEQIGESFSSHVKNLHDELLILEKKQAFDAIVKIGISFQTKIAVHAAILKDIEVSAFTNTSYGKEETLDTTSPQRSVIISLQKKLLPVVTPTVAVTEKALEQISDNPTAKEKEQGRLTLTIDHNEAKKYMTELHRKVGIPATILKTTTPPLTPIFVPKENE